MLSDATQENIRRWVAARLDVAPSQLAIPGLHVKSHGPSLADYNGVYVWRMGQITIVSAPIALIEVLRRAVAEQLADALAAEEFWRAALSERVARIVGPAYQGFLDLESFQPADAQGARPLTPDDEPALRSFIAACPPDDWRDSAIALDHEPIIGLERDGALVALASAPVDGPAAVGVRSVGVVALPAARGSGAGLAVVSALVRRCLATGATLHYQTLRANVPSVAIARRLGFADVATSLAVRLTAP